MIGTSMPIPSTTTRFRQRLVTWKIYFVKNGTLRRRWRREKIGRQLGDDLAGQFAHGLDVASESCRRRIDDVLRFVWVPHCRGHPRISGVEIDEAVAHRI